jgi:16S rRNA (guanine(966)-N(2))-methyltransferase RsmD
VSPAHPRPRPAGEVRIVGGQFKRSKLPVPDKPGLRPTPDRVRETLFNWLGQDLSGWRCIDAFGGSGALGFEAASRGAASVLIVERDAELIRLLLEAKTRLKANAVTVRRGDGLAELRAQPAASCDLVLLDPPFDSELLAPALQAAVLALAPGGFVHAEQGRTFGAAPEGLLLHRLARAGAVHHALFSKPAATLETVQQPAP